MSASTALIVIDAQESFKHRPYFSKTHFADYIKNQQMLIDGATLKIIPIIQIFHVEEEGVFSIASGHVKTLEELQIKPDLIIHKKRHSAFIGTPLTIWLTQKGIKKLIISGIRSEQCCETTTRHGSDLGYDIDYVTEATLTFAMEAKNGKIFSPEEIKEKTELVLSQRFAKIVNVEQALENI